MLAIEQTQKELLFLLLKTIYYPYLHIVLCLGLS